MGVFRQFPYSNFHEMNMDEIIKIIKNMLEEWAQYHAEWDTWMDQINDDWSNYQEVMNEAWSDMRDFINNYFDNLDVQVEINNKITSMVNSGEFADIVAPYIPARVSAWLSANITEPVGVIIDRSLTVAGACADASVVGNEIGILKAKTDAVTNSSPTTLYATTRETGGINQNGTINSVYDTYTALTFDVEPNTVYRFRGQFLWSLVGIAFYDSSDNFIKYEESNDPPLTTDTLFDTLYITPNNCTKVKVSRLGEYYAGIDKITYTNNLEDEIETINNTIGNATLKTAGNTLKSGINNTWDDIDYVADELSLTDYLQNLFALFRWNGTYGYQANNTGMSIIASQKFPYDVKITNLHFPDFIGATVRTFNSIIASPENLIDTISYTMYGEGAVNSIVLPKNTYWTIQFTRPNNVDIDLATYKVIPHFIAGYNIKFTNQLQKNNTLVVGKDFAPYTRIQDAVDNASSGDTILILPGTYEEAVSAWGKEVHLLGLDRDSTIIIEKSGLYTTPPLEINIGSVRNLTLIETGEGSVWGDDDGRGRAYAVHIENGDGYTGVGELWFENCKLINYAHAAVGCGLYQDLHVHFNNCYMYSGRASDIDDDRYRGTFYYHTCVAENITGQMMTVKDCEIINEDTKCFFGGVTPNAVSASCRSVFINNNFYALEALSQHSNDLAVVYSILNFHDCKLTDNSTGNNIPALNAF